MHTENVDNLHTSDSVRFDHCDDHARCSSDDHVKNSHHRRGGVSGRQCGGRNTMQDKQLERWCSNSEILCRVFTAYLTVWLGWALPQVRYNTPIVRFETWMADLISSTRKIKLYLKALKIYHGTRICSDS